LFQIFNYIIQFIFTSTLISWHIFQIGFIQIKLIILST
jgi:hypothetical protein